jgi:hypothetical protein
MTNKIRTAQTHLGMAANTAPLPYRVQQPHIADYVQQVLSTAFGQKGLRARDSGVDRAADDRGSRCRLGCAAPSPRVRSVVWLAPDVATVILQNVMRRTVNDANGTVI